MIGKELPLDHIVNNDFKQIVFERRSSRYLDPDYKVSREEIEEIINETNCITPSAVDTQPFMFLIVDTEEGADKLDSIMRGSDKDRVNRCSFAVVPFADREWVSYLDELMELDKTVEPEKFSEELWAMLPVGTYKWYQELTEGDASYLDKSVNFQAGMACMSFQFVCRAHGLDTSVMDSWDPDMLGELFDIDLDRYIPEVAIAVGKSLGSTYERYRYPAEKKIFWR